jgi:hypothetical protein
MYLPYEIINKIFTYISSDTSNLIKSEIIKYNEYNIGCSNNYKISFKYYSLNSFGLFRTGNVYCKYCHLLQNDMFVDLCDKCGLCYECCYKIDN